MNIKVSQSLSHQSIEFWIQIAVHRVTGMSKLQNGNERRLSKKIVKTKTLLGYQENT